LNGRRAPDGGAVSRPGRRRLILGTGGALAGLTAGIGRADDLPELIRVVVPLAPGSSLDARARMIAEGLGRRLQRRVLVENRPGAGGTVGALAVARARPDGATLLFVNNSHVVSPHIYPSPGYAALKDFTLVAPGYDTGLVLVAHPGLGATTLKELVARGRSGREPLSFASSGTGGLPHIAVEMFAEEAGLELVHVPYRGDGQAMTDVLPGRVPLIASGYPAAVPHVKAGKLRALAVTSAARTGILSDVPTLAEAGYPGATLDVWTAFFAPARTPGPVVERLNRELHAAMESPSLQEQFAATGARVIGRSRTAMADFVAGESERYARLVRKLGLKPEQA
jgi:tripartite-type tricarboxylate transporter receptor subunit TctC